MISKPNKSDKKRIKKSKTYKEIMVIAMRNVKAVYDKYTVGKKTPAMMQVCGPISTGGAGNVKDNLALFETAICTIKKIGYYVFNQIPYEDAMGRIKKEREKEKKIQPKKAEKQDKKDKKHSKKSKIKIKKSQKVQRDTYDYTLLEEFYRPIMESGMIACVVFLPGWRSSIGARWEYKVAKKKKILRLELKKNWLQMIKDGETNIHKLTTPITRL